MKTTLTGLQCKVEHILVPVQAWNVLSPFFYELVTRIQCSFMIFFVSCSFILKIQKPQCAEQLFLSTPQITMITLIIN